MAILGDGDRHLPQGETGEIAIHAALTGHVVFSTLHTNDAAGAVTRMVDMGLEPFLVASSLSGVVAQRLVRRVCSNCSEPYKYEPEALRASGRGGDARPPATERPWPLSPQEVSTSCVITKSW